MKILLAAKHAPDGKCLIGGVQSWCRTVAEELKRQGHTVKTWGPEQKPLLGGFDLGIFANVADTIRAWNWCTKHLIVCHGIIPAEKPLTHYKMLSTFAPIVFTSEEVRDYWNGNGPVIRQPIDLNFWSADSRYLQIFLTRFSYRSGLPFIKSLAKSWELQYYHLRNADSKEVRKVIRQSACVLATGRAALEAMACGVPVVICDHRSAYQGPLLDLDPTRAMLRNYSGRGGVTPTINNVQQAVEQMVAAGSMREHVVTHHNVVNIVEQLLEAA